MSRVGMPRQRPAPVARYRVTETRQVVIEIDEFDEWFFNNEPHEDAAAEIAADLPATEWDTLDRQVEPL